MLTLPSVTKLGGATVTTLVRSLVSSLYVSLVIFSFMR